jgi:DNA-binding transcriptional MerR regulator
MLMKIGDVTNKFGISHRSLHYWESVGILQSSRGENDYRHYDEENVQKIKQIVLLRKLRLSIPSIQEIFTSNELSKITSVFTSHLDDSKKEVEQLNALGTVLQQLINMLKDRRNIETVYNFLDANHSTETEELKAALQTVLSEPVKEIAISESQPIIIDMTGVDLFLEDLTVNETDEAVRVIKQCYPNIEEMDKLLFYFNLEQQMNMPDCTTYYKIIQSGKWIGTINLAYIGRQAMLIRCIACSDSEINIYLFELLKQKHPDIMCWNIYLPNDESNKNDFCYDWDCKKKQFLDDNGFIFYTNARWNRYIKMIKPHDEVYNSSKYRFALLDGSMDDVTFRFFGVNGMDCYDGKLTNLHLTDVDFSEAFLYDTWMEKSKFYDTGIPDSDFRYCGFNRSTFFESSFENCKIEKCNIQGLTIDGINVEEAIMAFRDRT